MANWKTYIFPDAVRADNYADKLFEILFDGVAANLTGASISMWLVDRFKVKVTEYTMANSKIIVTNAALGKFKIVFGKITVAPGTYNYDLQITFADGTVKTYIKGTLTVLDDETKTDVV